MLLYKYKAFSPLEHVLDLAVNERLFCAPYKDLNDPFEGQFQSRMPKLEYLASGYDYQNDSLSLPVQHKSVADLITDSTATRVCSLSGSSSDVRLWSLYADGHKGLVFEIDFSGVENSVYKVDYRSQLPEFGAGLLTQPFPEDVLTCKTEHWKYEAEYRIIGDQPYFSISGRIKRIIVGFRAPTNTVYLLKRLAPQLTIVHAMLDHDAVSVQA